MKIRALREIFRDHDNVLVGQVLDLPEDEARWWIEQGYGEVARYETKPHVEVPMPAGGRVTQPSSPPPARRSRKTRSKPAGDAG
jgi:hypothetical protein